MWQQLQFFRKSLSFTALVIRDAQFLHPEKGNDPAFLTAVSKLTFFTADVLQSLVGNNVFPKVFHTQPTLKQKIFVTWWEVNWKLFQTECLPEEFYV